MSEPWFDPNAWSWVPGTVYGMLGGFLGALSGLLAPQGRAKGLVMGLYWSFIVIACAFLAISAIALASGQPYGVWYGFGLPGLLGMIVLPILLPVVRLRYREAEERRMVAQDLTTK